jgi:hypothetical protein
LDGCIQVYIGWLHPSLYWMAASKFILDAAIQFKLGCAPPSELLTDSNSAAWALIGQQFTRWGMPKFESDGRIRYKLGCSHPSQIFWWCPKVVVQRVATL